MILVWGLRSDDPIERVYRALILRRAPVLLLDQRDTLQTDCHWSIDGDHVRGRLTFRDGVVSLEDLDAVYTRALDVELLPEVKAAPPNVRRRARAWHDMLTVWCERTPARVVNRLEAMASNTSKPYQARLIARQGFLVPETIITNQPGTVRAFAARHGRIIYKSISGVRSIARELRPEDEQRLDRIRWCPTQFQEWIEGTDVRVHVIGRRVFAIAIRSTATDYRYAHREGHDIDLQIVDLDDEVAERCRTLAEALGLAFAGIDLKVTPEGRVFCFEVNPSPGFSYFEQATGQAIADAVAGYLLGEG